jgi:hypothetical protein
MKLTVEGIQIIDGKFIVIPPGLPADPNKPKKDSATLMLECKFALRGPGDTTLAVGLATNGEGSGGTAIKMSPSTLKAFHDFFNSLEHDIASALESKTGEKRDERTVLAELLAK